jgi:hypothetical protein
MRLNSAIAAVLRGSPQTRELIEEFRKTQQRLSELRSAMRELWRHHGALPADAQSWDHVVRDEDFPQSQLAATVKDWIARLKHDPEAALNRDPQVM